MDYAESVKFVYKTPFKKHDNSLDSIKRLLDKLGNPQIGLKYIHIAGTNGKGSTSSFISTVLKESGYRVGFLVSPFIHVFNERFQINNENISDEKLVKYIGIVKKACDEIISEGHRHPIQFEINTAIGYLYFREENCDIIMLEVGIGGTYDATNIITDPLLSIITSISHDHTNVLGDSLLSIAKNKAGIIKKNHPVLIYDEKNSSEVLDVFIKKANEADSKLYRVKNNSIKNIKIHHDNFCSQSFDYKNNNGINLKNITLTMLGQHQINNAALAIEGCYIIKEMGYSKINDETIIAGLKKTRWPGRFEVLSSKPPFIVDGAHNEGSVKMLLKNLETFFPDRKISFIVGFLKEKDYETLVNITLPLSKDFYTFTPPDQRGLDGLKVHDYLHSLGVEVYNKKTSKEIIQLALENKTENSVFCAFGSLYSVADFRDYFLDLR